MADVRFAVLGRVSVSVDGVEMPVRGRRERAVLAMLLAARGRVVSVDRLIEDIWGADAGSTAPGSLQVAISRLRARVEPDRPPRSTPRLLVSSGAGYALLAPASTVDAEDFATAVHDAHADLCDGRPAEALDRVEEAQHLWSGVPFGQVVDSALVRAETVRLQDLHTSSGELRVEALLALGRHALVTSDLEALLVDHPLRERLWELYALALYRSGRQGDALAALRRARGLLCDELGIDPSPALQKLEADILAQVPGLEPDAAPSGRRSSAQVSLPAQIVPSAAADTDRPALIGRDEAVRILVSELRDVVAGRGRVVLVSGEAGIGKTRLVTHLAEAAAAAGARILWGRCHEADVSPAYWPWMPIMRKLDGLSASPEVSQLVAPSEGVPGPADADSAALRTYDAVSRLLAAEAQAQPLVVVLEDLHWADPSSLQLLAFAAEALRDDAVLLLATTREADDPSPALQSCYAALARLSATRLVLSGLRPDDVRDLVATLSRSAVDSELTDVLAERTDGNPFFVLELVRLLAAQHRLDADGARAVEVPHGVQDVLRLRIARLPEDVRRLLSVAAVTGRAFDLDLLAAVARTDPDTVLDLLDRAVGAQVVEEADVPGCYRFTHALVRETLYTGLSGMRRGRLHAATAVALERRLAADPDLVTEVAHHFGRGAAVDPGLAEPAVRHAVAAARLAESRGALDQALVHWEEALASDGFSPDEVLARRFEVLLGIGRARYRRGDVAGSRQALDGAVEVARSLGDIELMAQAATSFRGAGVWHWREFGTTDPAMVEVLQECLAVLPAGPLSARVLASLAMELIYEWRSGEADAVSLRAVQTARAAGDDDLLADVASMRALALWGRPGAAEVRLALHAEVLALDLTREQELYTRFGAAAAHLQLGQTVEADRQITRCLELTRRLRHTGADVPLAWWRFHRALAAGRGEDVDRLGQEALERHRRSSIVAIDDMFPMVRLRCAGAGAEVDQGFVEGVGEHANPAFRAFIAAALAESGRAEEAVGLLGEPVPDGAWDYASVYGDCLRVDVLATAGRTDLLPAALDRIRPWGHELAIYGSTDCIGSIDYFVGRGLEALGDPTGAREAYERAVERNQAAGILPWLNRAQKRLADLMQPTAPSSA